MMKRMGAWVSTAVVVCGIGLGGCVNQGEYDSVAESNMTYQSRIEQLHQENRTLQATLDRKQVRIDELESEMGGLRTSREDLSGRISDAQAQQRRIRERLANLRLGGVDPETDRALQRLADSNPNLIAYDADRGMVRLTSDLTFDSGSDVVKDGAKATLKMLAEIMMTANAQAYDLHVVGHTDNQRISNPATRAKHPTNRHLSVHRAIAVSESMQSFGLPANRILTGGWGEQHPAVPNRATGGTPENRRVEIFMVPSETGSSAGAIETQSAPAEQPAASGRVQPQPMK